MRFIYTKISILIFLVATPTFASITFTDGKWESTFDCVDWDQFDVVDCDGIERSGNWSCDGTGSSIESAANNPDGDGGKGARFWKCSGDVNLNSGTLKVVFPSAQNEIWVRWYERYESGFSWGGSIDVKSLYFKDAVSNPYVGYQGGRYRMYWGGSDGPWPGMVEENDGGWEDVYGTTSDGSWHCFEVYMKMDTNGSNGVGRLWVDGNLVAEETTIDYGTVSGWDYFDFLSNQKDPGLARAYYVDFDDVVIYNTTPPNTDSEDNPYIGPLGETSENAEPPSTGTTLLSESFENDSWSARSWYDGTDSTGTTSGGYSGNALEWTWTSSATKPTGFSTIRRKFTASNEFLIEYYVKYETGWRGSGQNYHPHLVQIASSEDTDYQGTGDSNSMLYFESVANTSSPYTNYYQVAHQDMQRVNQSEGTPPVDLRETTETRSANHCNTPYSASGATGGDCYADGADYYSANRWRAQAITIPANEWVLVQVYIKGNTFSGGEGNFDGILRAWVGGDLAVESEQVLFAAGVYESVMAWDKLILAPYIGDGSPIEQSMWIDELTISTVGIETPATFQRATIGGKSPSIGGMVPVFVDGE